MQVRFSEKQKKLASKEGDEEGEGEGEEEEEEEGEIASPPPSAATA